MKQCLTLTFDDGKEFSQHEFIAKCPNTQVYFARPWHSLERGTNENTNGLLRQLFPKGRSLKNQDCVDVGDVLNRSDTVGPIGFRLWQTPLHP